MNFSGVISQVRVKAEKGRVYIVVLTKDFNEGFDESIYTELKSHLLKVGEEAIGQEEIIIVKPLKVEISAAVWFKKNEKADMLFISHKFNEIMENYLNPVKGNGKQGWPIGKLPNMSQLIMQLNVLREWGTVENLSVTAGYEHNGRYKECGISGLQEDFSMIAVSGKHEIHFI